MRVSTNVSSINAQRTLAQNDRAIAGSFEKLASGSRINKAADDAAGLAISESLNAQVRSAHQAKRNTNDGISVIQTAEGGLNEIGNMIVRLRELGIQASSDTVSDDERGFINAEVSQLKDEIQRISDTTKWGKTNLLDGSSPNFDFQVGIFNDDSADRITWDTSDNVASLDALGLSSIDFSDKSGAQTGLGELDSAQTEVSRIRSNIGALQNRLVSTTSNLASMEENLSAAKSRIRDTDVAEEKANQIKHQILMQANTATLAQANTKSQLALQLIG